MSPSEASRRTPKGGGGHGSSGSSSGGSPSSSSDKSGSSSYRYGSHPAGTTTTTTTTGGGGGGGGGQSVLPWWAILIIVLGTIFLVLFLCALGYYCIKERKRMAKGDKFRAGYVMWKAFCVASGLWLPIWLLKKLKGRKGIKSAGSYSKIEEGHSTNNVNNNNNNGNKSKWYGASATPVEATPYSHGGTSTTAGADGARYEPVGYTNTSTAAPISSPREASHSSSGLYDPQPVIIGPIEQTDAIPLPTPTASPAPSMVSMVSAMTGPPPYPGGPLAGAAAYKPPVEQPTYVQSSPPAASQYGQASSNSENSGGPSAGHYSGTQPSYAAPGTYH